MSAADDILCGDENIVTEWTATFGAAQAAHMVTQYNNGCIQIDGFEQLLFDLRSRAGVFLAPLISLSTMIH